MLFSPAEAFTVTERENTMSGLAHMGLALGRFVVGATMVLRWNERRSYQLGDTAVTGLKGWACGDCGAVVLDRAVHDRFHINLGPSQETGLQVAFRR